MQKQKTPRLKRKTEGTYKAWRLVPCDPECKRAPFHFGPCLPYTLVDVEIQATGRPGGILRTATAWTQINSSHG